MLGKTAFFVHELFEATDYFLQLILVIAVVLAEGLLQKKMKLFFETALFQIALKNNATLKPVKLW